MNKIVVSLILLLGLLLRINNYQHNPPRGASSDEYTYTFMGMSLLKSGVPTSWSNFQAYDKYGGKREDLTIDKIYFPLVTPYFDHTPLNGIVVGAWALIRGEDTFEKVTINTIRQVPIFLGMISSLLVYLLALKIYGRKTALWSLLIYSTTTITVMLTRTVFAENLLTPLLLGSILLFLTLRKTSPIVSFVVLGILAGLSIWAKELGIVTFLGILSLLIYEKFMLRQILVFTGVFTAIALLYPLYGFIYNWELFMAVILTQGARELGPNTLNTLFFHPIVVNKLYFDGWYLFGFVSFFASFLDFKKHTILIIPSFLYFLLMLFTLTQHGEMGWYMIPMFPFMAIFSARLLVESLTKQSLFVLLMLLIVGLYNIRYLYEAPFGLTPFTFRILMLILFGPFILSLLLNKDRFFRLLGNVWFYIFMSRLRYIGNTSKVE